MNRRDLIKLALGSAVAAVVLPEVVPAGTPLTELAPHGIDAFHSLEGWTVTPTPTDVICPRTPTGLDVYSSDGTFKGIYRQ